ncbi:MAG: glycosyltransferase family 4 protein [Magnetococcus sp. YQC-9]
MTDEPEVSLALIRQRYTPFGGAERFLDRAMSALRSRGVTITLIARRWEGECGDIETVRCNPWYLGRWWRDAGFAACVGAHLAKRTFDLTQSHERIPGCDLYRAGDGVHAEWLDQRGRTRDPLSRWLERLNPYHRYLLAQERKLFEHPDLEAVICNSRMVRAEILARFRIAPEKIAVIYSGVDPETFHPEVRARLHLPARAEWGIDPDELLLLFVGSGFERKGLLYLLTALARMPPPVRLLVVGHDKAQARMAALTKRLGVADRVIFTGGRREVVSCYAAADAVVLPTLYDPFPNVALEAMAMGLPLVTSFKCGAVDLIEHGRNGLLCDPLDIPALTANLESLRDAHLRADLGRAAREAVAELTLEAMSARLLELYQSLLINTKPHPA